MPLLMMESLLFFKRLWEHFGNILGKTAVSAWLQQFQSEYKLFSGTVFIVGSGATTFGWSAMEAACHAISDSDLISSKDLSAWLVFQLRTFSSLKSDQAKRAFKDRKVFYDKFIQAIGQHTQTENDKGSIRHPTHYRAKELLAGDSVAFITMNYDTLLENHFAGRPVLHLHGSTDAGDTLVLPTEMAIESYRDRVDADIIHYSTVGKKTDGTLTAIDVFTCDRSDTIRRRIALYKTVLTVVRDSIREINLPIEILQDVRPGKVHTFNEQGLYLSSVDAESVETFD